MYLRPRTLDEALAALAGPGAQVLAGGTDVFPALADKPQKRPFIDISGLSELRVIEVTGGQVRIGAGATWTDLIRADLPRGFDALKAAAREVGSVQIQNRATLAGNICNASPAADGVPPLMALDASVEITSGTGVRHLPIDQFMTGYRRTVLTDGEMVTAILVPQDMARARAVFLKLGSRRYLVISIAMVAAMLRMGGDGRIDRARVAVGACSAVAQRLPELEAVLIGHVPRRGIGAVVQQQHVLALTPIDDVRATATYRTDAVRTMVARALERCAEEA